MTLLTCQRTCPASRRVWWCTTIPCYDCGTTRSPARWRTRVGSLPRSGSFPAAALSALPGHLLPGSGYLQKIPTWPSLVSKFPKWRKQILGIKRANDTGNEQMKSLIIFTKDKCLPCCFDRPWQACRKNNFGFPARLGHCTALKTEVRSLISRNFPFTP